MALFHNITILYFCFSQKKIARLLQQAKDIKVKFETRKRNRSLPFHEEQLHRFDRYHYDNLSTQYTDLLFSSIIFYWKKMIL